MAHRHRNEAVRGGFLVRLEVQVRPGRVATVILLTRLTLRLTRSPRSRASPGLLLAIDGVNLPESRIGLLDVFIGFFATLTVYCLVRDREWSRAPTRPGPGRHLRRSSCAEGHLRLWFCWRRYAGLTCSIKWSGLYLLAAIGILVVV